VEPDWLLVFFKGPKPPPDRRNFFLQDSLAQWLRDHPGRTVAQTESIHRTGELVGLHVWLEPAAVPKEPTATPAASSLTSVESTLSQPPREPSRPRKSRQGKFPVSIDNELVESVHKEHLEAMIDHAYSILLKDEGKSPAMAVISRGGLAVVLDRETNRSHLMRLARLNLRGRALQELQRWQTAGETNYFVLPMKSYEFGE
jgi:hypothetical protein